MIINNQGKLCFIWQVCLKPLVSYACVFFNIYTHSHIQYFFFHCWNPTSLNGKAADSGLEEQSLSSAAPSGETKEKKQGSKTS